jgi:peroxiredoxin
MIRRGGIGDLLLAGLVLGIVLCLLAHRPRFHRPGDDPLHASWVGTEAPPLAGQAVNGPAVRLDALRGRPVVVVFWETWCAACRRELAHLDRLVREVPEVAVLGVSDEPEETIREFLARRPIAFPMLSMPEPPAPFDIRSIPTNVFLDRNGVIRAVQVASLEFEDLAALATGPEYVPTPAAAPGPPAPDDFVERWSADVPGVVSLTTCDWDGDGADEVAALSGRALHVLDANGRAKARVVLPEGTRRVECTGLPDGSVRVLAYETWGATVSVLDHAGAVLWSYPTKGGVDGAHWGHLDGDGTPEMIVGLNGDGGLHAVSVTGQPLWHAGDLKNVWNQAVASHGGGATVAVTQAGGFINVFDAKGRPLLSRFRPGGEYYAPIAAVALPGGGVQIVAATDRQAVAFGPAGEVVWHAPITASREAWSWPVFASGDLTGDGVADWVFPSEARPRMLAVHAISGERAAALRLPVAERTFAVLPRRDKALLVVASANLRAYELR